MSTVLIIEDSKADRAAIRRMIAGSGLFDHILEASHGVEGLKLLRTEAIDVVVCDLEMPGLDGEKLLLAKSQDGARIPFVIVTASSDLERKARVLENGASDVITKPAYPNDLRARLRKQLEIKWLQDELLRKHEALTHLSITDQLTGLSNRRHITESLSVEFLRAQRYRTPLTVMMADIDHFKAVNDDFGHPTGDAVLRGIGEIFRSNRRETDVAGRYGGEEIMLILANNDLEGGITYAERLRESVEVATFDTPDDKTVQVTVSIGLATHDPGMRTPDDLVAAADAALYRAKRNGRNRVEVNMG